jgi:hypothetical protein
MLYRVQESLDTEQMGEILYVFVLFSYSASLPFLKILVAYCLIDQSIFLSLEYNFHYIFVCH